MSHLYAVIPQCFDGSTKCLPAALTCLNESFLQLISSFVAYCVFCQLPRLPVQARHVLPNYPKKDSGCYGSPCCVLFASLYVLTFLYFFWNSEQKSGVIHNYGTCIGTHTGHIFFMNSWGQRGTANFREGKFAPLSRSGDATDVENGNEGWSVRLVAFGGSIVQAQGCDYRYSLKHRRIIWVHVSSVSYSLLFIASPPPRAPPHTPYGCAGSLGRRKNANANYDASINKMQADDVSIGALP